MWRIYTKEILLDIYSKEETEPGRPSPCRELNIQMVNSSQPSKHCWTRDGYKLPCGGVRAHPTGLCKPGRDSNECHQSKKKLTWWTLFAWKYPCLFCLLSWVRLEVFHQPIFPSPCPAWLVVSPMTFMAVSLEQAFRRESPQQWHPTETSAGAAINLLICGCKDAGQPSILTILFIAVTKLCFIPLSTHWPILTQPDWWV